MIIGDADTLFLLRENDRIEGEVLELLDELEDKKLPHRN
jgi:hypothetical protein